jgi:hypothetical protein
MVGKEYMGSFIMVAIFAMLNQFVICLVKFPPPPSKDTKEFPTGSVNSSNSGNSRAVSADKQIRPMCEIISQPIFILACTIATLAHTIMVMVMSNVSVDMKDNNYSVSTCSIVMEIHFFSMFAPGFFSGKMIEKYGTFIVSLVGGVIFAGSSVILVVGRELWNYILGMSLVGFAWNLSFSAGTVMLTTCYRVSFISIHIVTPLFEL